MSGIPEWFSDDITFCGSECNNKLCFRHKSNIKITTIPHSFALFKDTPSCPFYVEEDLKELYDDEAF